MMPFGNNLLVMTLTGAQLEAALEQQFAIPLKPGRTVPAVLAPSAGFTYAVDMSKPEGSRVSDLRLNGKPIVTDRPLPRRREQLSRVGRRRPQRVHRGHGPHRQRDHRPRCSRRLDRPGPDAAEGRTASASVD